MANLDQAPSRSMPNPLHVLAFADEAELRLNTIVELNSNTINKYELITETGHLKLDRVGYSWRTLRLRMHSLTWMKTVILDIECWCHRTPDSRLNCRSPHHRNLTFDDGGEVDDKVIAVLADDKRMDHIKSWEDLGDHWKKETTYYWSTAKDRRSLAPLGQWILHRQSD